uniref:DUF4339 domain-containing protein n=1 Tax=Prosthecobacter sp. TaxID=1965333 RepID=UPI0037C5225E
MPESLYYIQKDGNEVGPLSFEQMRSLWGRAEITVRTSFRYEKENIWRPVALLQSELDEPMEMPPALATQKPEKTGSYTKTGCGCLFIGIVLFIIIASASNRNQSSSSRLENYPPVKSTSQHVESPAPTITWKEIDEFFFKGNNTDQQRADKLKYYKGRQVSWRGRVVKTSEKLFGGMTLSIKMNADTITHDVDLDLKSSETSRATALSENS